MPVSREKFLKEGKRAIEPVAFLRQYKTHAFSIREIIEGSGLSSGWTGGTFMNDLINCAHYIPVLQQYVTSGRVEVRIVQGEPHYHYVGDDKH